MKIKNKKTKTTPSGVYLPNGKRKEKVELAGHVCNDKDCHIHGRLKTRGKTFEGVVIRKFHKRITIEFERMIYIKKYERYSKSKTKVHARLPTCMEKEIRKGDLVKIQECRPLSKIIHFIVVSKIKQRINAPTLSKQLKDSSTKDAEGIK